MRMTSFSVLINSVHKGPIMPSRELRQRDPLSPYLFLCTEGLVTLLKQFLVNKSLMGISECCGAPTINHLLFTNDSLMFYKENEVASNNLLKILNEYAKVWGQCINMDKTTIIFSRNVKEANKTAISAMWGCKGTK